MDMNLIAGDLVNVVEIVVLLADVLHVVLLHYYSISRHTLIHCVVDGYQRGVEMVALRTVADDNCI